MQTINEKTEGGLFRPAYAALLLIILLTIALNAGFLRNKTFFRDDFHFIVNNPSIRSIENIPSYFVSLPMGSSVRENQVVYRPVVTASYAVNYYLGGLGPFGYHVFNLIVHLLNIVMVCLIVRFMTAEEYLALGSALLFAVHPLNSELINFINTRSSSMSTLFCLVSFFLYIKATAGESGKRGLVFLWGSVAAFTAALFTKELSIMLPLVIVIYDLLFRRYGLVERMKEAFKRYTPYFVSGIGYMALRSALLKSEGLTAKSHHLYDNIYVPVQILTFNLKLLIYPKGLSVFYFDFNPAAYLGLASALSLVIVVCWLLLPLVIRNRVFTFFVFWMFIMWLPTTAFEMKSTIAMIVDHRLYIAAPGFSFCLAVIIYRLCSLARRVFKGLEVKKAYAAGVFAVAAVFTFIHIGRNSVWKDSVSIAGELVEKYPGQSGAHTFLAEEYARKGMVDKAAAEYMKSYEIDPYNVKVLNNLAGILITRGRLDEAAAMFRQIIEISPSHYNSYFGLGYVYERKGLYGEAVRKYERGLKFNPRSTPALLNLADLYLRQGLLDAAEMKYNTVLEIDPANHRAVSRLKEISALR